MGEKAEVLCYGDSNTWGCIPRWEESNLPSQRYDEFTRWTGVAQRLLGEEFHLIEEGLNGRTTKYDLPDAPWKNGSRFLRPCLMTHRPLDLVVIMLGTNDLHGEVQPKPENLGDGIGELIRIIREQPDCGRGVVLPDILVVAPPHIKKAVGRTLVYGKFNGDTGRALSLSFCGVYGSIAAEAGCHFLDAALYAPPSDADGVHLTAEAHMSLGRAVSEKIVLIHREGRRKHGTDSN